MQDKTDNPLGFRFHCPCVPVPFIHDQGVIWELNEQSLLHCDALGILTTNEECRQDRKIGNPQCGLCPRKNI